MTDQPIQPNEEDRFGELLFAVCSDVRHLREWKGDILVTAPELADLAEASLTLSALICELLDDTAAQLAEQDVPPDPDSRN